MPHVLWRGVVRSRVVAFEDEVSVCVIAPSKGERGVGTVRFDAQ